MYKHIIYGGWKPSIPQKVSGFNDYRITRDGRVYSQKTHKWLAPSLSGRGYIKYVLSGKTRNVHRLIALTYIPNPKNLPQVNHKDGNKQNNRVENLEWCSQSDNMKHAYRTGLQKPFSLKGSARKSAKLTESKVVDIRKKYSQGSEIANIAREYKVSYKLVSSVVKGLVWRHV